MVRNYCEIARLEWFCPFNLLETLAELLFCVIIISLFKSGILKDPKRTYMWRRNWAKSLNLKFKSNKRQFPYKRGDNYQRQGEYECKTMESVMTQCLLMVSRCQRSRLEGEHASKGRFILQRGQSHSIDHCLTINPCNYSVPAWSRVYKSSTYE